MQVALEDQIDVDPDDEATIREHLHKVVSPQLIACIFVKKAVHFQKCYSDWLNYFENRIIRSFNNELQLLDIYSTKY